MKQKTVTKLRFLVDIPVTICYNLVTFSQEVRMAEEKDVLMYKGFPLMRKDNLIYYG